MSKPVTTPSDSGGASGVGPRVRDALGYVPAVARRFSGYGLSLDELTAAGNLGLVQAAIRFDPGRDVKFVTYADWWIRKAILDAIQKQAGPVHLPRYQHEKLRALQRSRSSCRARFGRDPSMDELARDAGMSAHSVEQILFVAPAFVSLEQPASPHGDRPLKELIRDGESECPQDVLLRQNMAEHLRRQLAALDAKPKAVIILRFGLDGRHPRTLREAGNQLGISREQVRQIEKRALARLRERLGSRPDPKAVRA